MFFILFCMVVCTNTSKKTCTPVIKLHRTEKCTPLKKTKVWPRYASDCKQRLSATFYYYILSKSRYSSYHRMFAEPVFSTSL